MLQQGCGQEAAKPFLASRDFVPLHFFLENFLGPLLHTRRRAPSGTMGLALSPSVPPVSNGAAHSSTLCACSGVERAETLQGLSTELGTRVLNESGYS